MIATQLFGAWAARIRVRLQNGIVQSTLVLVGGTVFAQALATLALPVLTRIYTPQDFSILAVYASLVAILSVAACLRLEIAIPLQQSDCAAANLLAVALLCSLGASALTAGAVLFAPSYFINIARQPLLLPDLWLVPVGVWLTSAYTALQYWAMRNKRFSLIARTRITQSIGGAVSQILLGWAGTGPLGLLVGQTIKSGAGISPMAKDAFKTNGAALRTITLRGMMIALKENQRFPKFSALESLANTAHIQVPILIIAATAIGPQAGLLILAMRVLHGPMGFIGTALSQVYLSHAADEHRRNNLGIFTGDILSGLIRTGVGPLIFAGIVAPVAFHFVFGPDWGRAGDFVAWLTPWFVIEFLASPISMALHVTGRQGTALALQACGLALRVGAVAIASVAAAGLVVQTYAIASALFYLCYFLVVCFAVRLPVRRLASRPLITPVLIWAVSGGLVRIAAYLASNRY